MEAEINMFTDYLHDCRKKSENTIVSYHSDLIRLKNFMEKQGITDVKRMTSTHLNSYLFYLEKNGFSAATISRSIASLRAFYRYLRREGLVREEACGLLQRPKAERKLPEILTPEETARLLEQPSGDLPKEIRDKAMLELLYATGIRVTELIHLKREDVNLQVGYIICREEGRERRERVIPFGKSAQKALERYLEEGRAAMTDERTEYLFVNCLGKPMSRQGFWKLVKHYAERAGISMAITPQTLRHSFAAHLLANGADLKSVQEMLGHSELSSTQVYAAVNQNKRREIYAKAHPRA